MSLTPRALRDSIQNALDFLFDTGFIVYAQSVALSHSHVSWHAQGPVPSRFLDDDDGSVVQYLRWLGAGHYSAVLVDGSLLQLTYSVEGGEVARHRLGYVPCPVALEEGHVTSGDPIGDMVELLVAEAPLDSILLRSSIRFDYDPGSAKPGHPATHLTINSSDCRIACVAPLHPQRFVAFIFQHFYSHLITEHRGWFSTALQQTLGDPSITDADRKSMHLNWDAR